MGAILFSLDRNTPKDLKYLRGEENKTKNINEKTVGGAGYSVVLLHTLKQSSNLAVSIVGLNVNPELFNNLHGL